MSTSKAFIIKTVLLSFASFFLLGSQAKAGDLDVRVAPVTAKLLAGDALSCSGMRVSGGRFAFPQVMIGWKNKSPLSRLSVIVAFQSSHIVGESYLCELSSNEIKAVFGLNEPAIAGGSTAISICPLQCGGIRLVDGAGFTAPGAMTVVGRYQGSGGRTFSAQISVPVAIEVAPSVVEP